MEWDAWICQALGIPVEISERIYAPQTRKSNDKFTEERAEELQQELRDIVKILDESFNKINALKSLNCKD